MDNGFHEWMQKALDSGIDGEDPFELSQAAWEHQEKNFEAAARSADYWRDLYLKEVKKNQRLKKLAQPVYAKEPATFHPSKGTRP